MKCSEAAVNQRVTLTRCYAPYAKGQKARVERIIKSRKVLRVVLMSGPQKLTSYDAHAANCDAGWPEEGPDSHEAENETR